MKKFLTVLLALSVVFTYSFSAVGSVFAADGPTKEEKAAKLSEAKEIAEKMVSTYYDDAMEDAIAATKATVDAAIPATFEDADYEAAWKKVDVKGLLATKIAEEYVEEAKTLGKYDADAAVYAAAVFGVSTKDASGELTATAITEDVADKIASVGEKEAMLNLYDAKKASIMEALDNVDYSLYLNTVDPENVDGKTYLQQAQDKVAAAKKTIKDSTIMNLDADTIDAQKIATGIAKVKDTVEDNVAAIEIGDTGYYTGLYTVIGVLTKEQVEAADREDAASVAEIKAAVQKKYVAAMNAGADKANADAYVTVANYLAEKGFIDAAPEYGTTDWKTPVDSIADLTTYAAKYKAEKDATGALVRDPAAVDAVVEKATNTVYGTVANSEEAKNAGKDAEGKAVDVAAAESKIANMSAKTDAADLAFAKEAAKKALENAKADAEDAYYPLEAKKVDAKYAEILAEIEAADTVAKAEAAQAKIATAIDDIDDKEDVDGAIDWNSGAAKADLDDVKYQIDHLNRGKTILDAGYIDASDEQIKAALAKIYGEAGARTDKEIKALKTDTAAVAASLPTVGAKDSAKKAVEDAIKALPSKATEADLATVEAADKAVAEYKKLGGTVDATSLGKLDTAKTQVKTDMLKNLTIAYAQLDKTDKAAVNALKEKIDAAVELDKKDNLFGDGENDGTTFNTLKTGITGDREAIREAERKAVVKAIDAIPLNVTEADRATVEAARKAYDAFVAEWTDYEEPYDAANEVGVDKFRELALAEAALSLNDNIEQDIYGTHVKIFSKAGKGYIKISWDQKDNGVKLDGYEVYRSTKKNSGFKKISTFKVQKSKKYTKNMKKGTKYYFYVKGYKMVGDEKVYAHKSITVARTFRK